MYKGNTPTTSGSEVRWLLGEYIDGENKVRDSVLLRIPTTSPVPSSVVGLAAQQPDGGGVRDVEPICYLMSGYTRRLMTFRVRERLRRYVAGVFQTVLRKRKPR